MHDNERLKRPFDVQAEAAVDTSLLPAIVSDPKVMVHGFAPGELHLIHSLKPHQRQIIMFLTDEYLPPLGQCVDDSMTWVPGLVHDSVDQAVHPDVDLAVNDKLKARIEEGCEMYPNNQPTNPEEHHADGLMRTVLRFNRRLRALDEEVNRPRSKRIPHLKRGGYGRQPGRK